MLEFDLQVVRHYLYLHVVIWVIKYPFVDPCYHTV